VGGNLRADVADLDAGLSRRAARQGGQVGKLSYMPAAATLVTADLWQLSDKWHMGKEVRAD
jgi:hypothetical protein